MRLWHTRTQQPVGQGGFHTAEVEAEGSTFRYVYDCGSENEQPLRNAIRAYTDSINGSPIDVLFLSHLDSDHVCGLDDLLVTAKVHTAVLPYLSPTARLVLIAQAAADSTIKGSLLGLWCDPTGWLAGRGVQRVIFVTDAEPPPDGWGPSDRPVLPPHNDQRGVDSLGLELHVPGVHASGSRPTPAKRYKSVAHVMPCNQALPLGLRGQLSLLNWQFVTFVHPEGHREEEFRKTVRRMLGRTYTKGFEIDQAALLETLRHPVGRDLLAACYTAIRRDRNLTSLSVYSGPIMRCEDASIRSSSGARSADEGWHPTGWLGTGDADLRTAVRRRRFVRHFDRLRDFVFTIMLPHHGSVHNFDMELLRFGFLASIAAGSHNSYGHPHKDVLCRLSPDRTHTTTEEPGSSLHETVRLA